MICLNLLSILLSQNLICILMKLKGPLTKSVDGPSHDSIELFFVLILLLVYLINVQDKILHLEVTKNLKEINLLNQLNLLHMVHSLAHNCLNTVKGTILETLRNILRLQKGNATLNKTLKEGQVIPVD